MRRWADGRVCRWSSWPTFSRIGAGYLLRSSTKKRGKCVWTVAMCTVTTMTANWRAMVSVREMRALGPWIMWQCSSSWYVLLPKFVWRVHTRFNVVCFLHVCSQWHSCITLGYDGQHSTVFTPTSYPEPPAVMRVTDRHLCFFQSWPTGLESPRSPSLHSHEIDDDDDVWERMKLDHSTCH